MYTFQAFPAQSNTHACVSVDTDLFFAVIVGPLQLPVDERSLRLRAALQEHTAVLHTEHTSVLHAASQAVHVVW